MTDKLIITAICSNQKKSKAILEIKIHYGTVKKQNNGKNKTTTMTTKTSHKSTQNKQQYPGKNIFFFKKHTEAE